MLFKKLQPEYFRNMIFGVEDSLVSTVGVLFGMAVAQIDKGTIFTTGLIIISVEALSMGVGSYLSEESAHELDGEKHKDKPYIEGLIMFLSYYLAGFVPLTPYLFLEPQSARYVSLACALGALFFLGYLPRKKTKAGIKMAVLAASAVLIGFLVGNFINGSTL